MPAEDKWHVPMTKVVRSGRKVRTVLMERVERLVRGNVIPKPVWYDVALAHPPPLKFKEPKPRKLTFPEDELRRTWLRRNPGTASMHPKALFIEDDLLPSSYRQYPGDVFVDRQMELMRGGATKDEAYLAAHEELEQNKRIRELEAETARQQAAALGAEPATAERTAKAMRPMLQQQLLRRFAEEARDQGLPYPRHWFDASGKWKGVGVDKMRDELLPITRKSLDRPGIDSDLVRTVISGLDVAAAYTKPSTRRSDEAEDSDFLPEEGDE